MIDDAPGPFDETPALGAAVVRVAPARREGLARRQSSDLVIDVAELVWEPISQ